MRGLLKFTAGVVLVLALVLSGPAQAEMGYKAVSATATSQTIVVNTRVILMINDGANEVYVRVFDGMQPPAAATTSNFEIKAGEGFEISRTLGVSAVSLVCSAAETATVRLIW